MKTLADAQPKEVLVGERAAGWNAPRRGNRRGHRLGRLLAVSHPTWLERDVAAERLELYRLWLIAAAVLLLAWGFLG